MVLRIRFSVGKPQIAEDRVLPESKQAPTPPKRIRFRFGSHEQHAPLPKKMKKTKKKLKNSTITAAEKAGLVNPTVRPLKLRVLFNRTPEQVQPPPHDFGMTSGCSFQYVGPLVPPPPSHLCLLSNGQFSDSVTDIYDDDCASIESVNQELRPRWPTSSNWNNYYSYDIRQFDSREERFNWMQAMSTANDDADEVESVGDNFDL